MTETSTERNLISRRSVIAAIVSAGGLLSFYHSKPFIPAQRDDLEVREVTLSIDENYVTATAVIDVDVDIWMRGKFQLTAHNHSVYLPDTEKVGRILIETGRPERISASWTVNDVLQNQIEGCIFRVIEVDR